MIIVPLRYLKHVCSSVLLHARNNGCSHIDDSVSAVEWHGGSELAWGAGSLPV